jgi:hypothetical protein
MKQNILVSKIVTATMIARSRRPGGTFHPAIFAGRWATREQSGGVMPGTAPAVMARSWRITMQPIPNNLSGIKHRPAASSSSTSGVSAGGTGFNAQLQSLLQKTKPVAQSTAPSMATTGANLHSGGMNDAAHHLLKLAGKG